MSPAFHAFSCPTITLTTSSSSREAVCSGSSSLDDVPARGTVFCADGRADDCVDGLSDVWPADAGCDLDCGGGCSADCAPETATEITSTRQNGSAAVLTRNRVRRTGPTVMALIEAAGRDVLRLMRIAPPRCDECK